ncbi:MAG: ferric reductase-like transmembrane domain-containing protein, partial [Acidobacteriota bacterium]
MARKQTALAIKLAFVILLLLWVALSLYTVFGSFDFSGIGLSALLYSLGKACGLIGFFMLSSLIISGDFARFFDRYFGLDRIIAFHRRYSLLVAVFVILHPIFFVLSSGSLNYLIPKFQAIPLFLGILAFYSYIVIEISSRIAKRIPYMWWQYLHALIYALFILSLSHALQIGSDTKSGPVPVAMALLFLGVLAGGIYRAVYKLRQRSRKYFVKEVRWETKDTFTIVLKQSQKLSFKPGQFCFLRLEKPGLHWRHPISISSAPHEEDLEFTIKLKGRFTKAASQLKPGEEVKLEGPFGIFTLEEERNEIVFIAFGVGITPFTSFIRDAEHSGGKQFTL